MTWRPRVVSMKWTKNSHLAADELTVTIGWLEGGVDPRYLKHARCRMWFWDGAFEKLDEEDHLRFTGICKKAARKLTESGWVVELTFHDYTSMFIMMRPFPSEGMPEYSDTFAQIWGKICDHTGYRDLSTGTFKSNVQAYKDAMRFEPPELGSRTLGESVNTRFHAVAKPTPPQRSDAWTVWQYCTNAVGLVSYIDRTELIVTTTVEQYKEDNAPKLLYGQNILEFEESVDSHVSVKGLLGKSFDPLTGVLLEAAYPDPDDPRIKKGRASAKRAEKEKRGVNLNETSAEYIEQHFPHITDQKALNEAVQAGWEEMSRQEMHVRIKTREMRLPKTHVERVTAEEVSDPNAPLPPMKKRSKGEYVDLLELRAGACIYVGIDNQAIELLKFDMSESDKIEHLMKNCGYIREVAELVVKNIGKKAYRTPIFHVETIELTYADGTFDLEIGLHNKVYI